MQRKLKLRKTTPAELERLLEEATREARKFINQVTPGLLEQRTKELEIRAMMNIGVDPDPKREPHWVQRAHSIAMMVINREYWFRRTGSPMALIELGRLAQKFRSLDHEIERWHKSHQGVVLAARRHGVIDDEDALEWQARMDRICEDARISRSKAWRKLENETGRKQETMSRHGVICPIPARRGRIKKSSL